MPHVNQSLGGRDRRCVAGACRDPSPDGRRGLLDSTANPVGCARPAGRVGLPHHYTTKTLRAPRRVCRAGAAGGHVRVVCGPRLTSHRFWL